MPESDTRQEKDALRFDGAPVKHIGGGKIEGYLIMFSGPDDPDLVGDFFTTETNFGNQKSTPIYYDHGMDSQIGLDEIGQGTWRVDAKGVWLEAQLDKRQAYVEDVLKLGSWAIRLARLGTLRNSSRPRTLRAGMLGT